MTGGGDKTFEVKLGRIRSASGDRHVQGFFKKVKSGARRLSNSGRGRRGRSAGRAHAANAMFQRRVIVKVHLARMDAKGKAAQRLHLDYIERDGTGREGEPAKVYNQHELEADKAAFLERGEDDRHQFRVIISPEDGNKLSDLTAYTRDVVKQMEADLGTKLDWVAANHYDTGQPHTHLIIRGQRDDCADLVIPRDYIAHGIRARAQEFVELELGPVTELEGRSRMARMVSQDRFTEIDSDILKRADGVHLDLTKSSDPRDAPWRRRLARMRMGHLENLGLATSAGKGRWTLDPDMRVTLRRLGERGDIIKSMHRAMDGRDHSQLLDASMIYDPASDNAKPITGVILDKGVADDINDRAFLIVDGLHGKPVYVAIGGEARLPDFTKGNIVTISPPSLDPRSSDVTIDKIARVNGGRYSATLHLSADKSARPEFIDAHGRRLEALRRQKVVSREADGSWRVPGNYLDQVQGYEKHRAGLRPVSIERHGSLTLRQMQTAMGSTWLDEHLRDIDDNLDARGFGAEVETARAARRNYLIKQGIIEKALHRLRQTDLDTLKARDLDDAGAFLSEKMGKAYAGAPQKGRIDGVYRESIDRASGRFAVIERAKDFSLVPWRDIIERNRGKSVSGLVRPDRVSWRLTKGRGIS